MIRQGERCPSCGVPNGTNHLSSCAVTDPAAVPDRNRDAPFACACIGPDRPNTTECRCARIARESGHPWPDRNEDA